LAERILIIDDDLDTLKLVSMMLERNGYETVTADTGPQGLQMARTEKPDLIILDVMMPEMDGLEVSRLLRRDEITRDIPIIMFTAKSQVDDKILGFEAGADDYLTKPTQPRELVAHIKAVLARSRKATREQEPPAGPRGSLIGVIGARGGLGISTLALNLGIALKEQEEKDVIVAEFRPGQGTIGMELGYPRSDGLAQLMKMKPEEINARSVENALITHPSGVRFLLASIRPREAQYAMQAANFEAIARHLPFLAQYVLVDLGPSIPPLTEKVAPLCDRILVVVEPVPQTLELSKILIDDLLGLGVGDGRITVVSINRVRSGIQLSWSQVQEQLGRSLAVIFTPAPELAYQAATNHVPMITQQPGSLTAQQFSKLAEQIVL
jgi:CheY-like chemotaxis protein/MinD-like ATPase involved in chromosome partitioning or flagellar assembly